MHISKTAEPPMVWVLEFALGSRDENGMSFRQVRKDEHFPKDVRLVLPASGAKYSYDVYITSPFSLSSKQETVLNEWVARMLDNRSKTSVLDIIQQAQDHGTGPLVSTPSPAAA